MQISKPDAVNGVIEIAIAKTDTALYPGHYSEQPAGHRGHQQRHVLDRANPVAANCMQERNTTMTNKLLFAAIALARSTARRGRRCEVAGEYAAAWPFCEITKAFRSQ